MKNLNGYLSVALVVCLGLFLGGCELVKLIAVTPSGGEIRFDFNNRSKAEEALKNLERMGMDLNIEKEKKTGRTLVHYVAKHSKNFEVLMLVKKYGGRFDIRDKRGNTAWDYAVKNKALRLGNDASMDLLVTGR